MCGILLYNSLTLQALLDWHACKADKAEGTEAQVVYERRWSMSASPGKI